MTPTLRLTRRALWGATAGVLLAAPVLADTVPQTLTIGLAAPIPTVDPHFYNATPSKILSLHIFDRLIDQTPENRLAPALALSWKPVSEEVWEFKLRSGVRFSNGDAFSGDDVRFTVERARSVPNSPGGFGGVVRQIASVEVVDAETLRIHTHGASPNLPNDLSNLAIISRRVGADATTEDYNSGKAAIGTGPYKLVRFTHGQGIELERNDDWWGPKPEWRRVALKFLPNAGGRSAALLSGSVDVIDVPSPNDLPRLRQDPRFSVFSHQGMRTIYLSLEQSSADPSPFVTDAAGQPLQSNPLRDLRVRRALSVAISREALAERVMQQTASPTGQWLPPGTWSYNPAVAVPALDPDKARQLLTEAGFPQGFRLTLHVPNDLRPTDAITAQAIAQMWTRVGVPTTVEAIPNASHAARAARHEFSINLLGWGSNSGEAGYALVNVLSTPDKETGAGAYNRGGYSNPRLDALTTKAMTTLDDEAREKTLQQAIEVAMTDVAIIPLYQLNNFWVTRKGLSYEASGHERTNAMAVRSSR